MRVGQPGDDQPADITPRPFHERRRERMNMAARLEALNKKHGSQILVAEST